MTSLFAYLHSNLKITPLDDDQVQVTVTLPSEHFLHFARLLDSLAGFVQIINRQNRVNKSKALAESLNLAEQAEQDKQRYYQRIVKAFDEYTAQGLNRYEAIKQIGADLRKEKHPWSSPDLIRPSLIAAGRGGRPGRPRKKS